MDSGRKSQGTRGIKSGAKQWFGRQLEEHRAAFFIGLATLKRHPLSAWLTILAISIILVLPLGGYVLLDHIKQLSQHVDKANHLTVFLKLEAKDKDVQSLIQNLKQIEEIQSIEHQTPEGALVEFEQKTNLNDLMALLPENPLPHSLIITPESAYLSLESMRALKAHLQSYPLIEHVVMDLDWVAKIEAITQLITKILSFITLFIGVGCIVILSNTIRLSLEKHRQELFIYGLMGATNTYIRRPFIYRAIIYGLLGALLAYGFVSLGLQLLREPTAALAELYKQVIIIDAIPSSALMGLVGFSLLLSWLSAKLAIWQFNKRPH